MPESISDDFPAKDEIAVAIRDATLLRRAATPADVDNVAAFVASDLARTITSTDVDTSAGAMVERRQATACLAATI